MYNPTAAEMTEFMPVVQSVVARFLGRLPANVLREDLIAAGTFGLIGALGKNPEARGPSFHQYAHIRVRSAILDELRAQDWLSRRARKSVVRKHGSDVSTAILPFDEDSVSDDATPHEQLEVEQERAALAEAIDQLPERERLIVRMHYFGDVQLKTIAQELGLSAARVTQLHTRAMGMLRDRVAA
jgi:RNA polymerase sigma factor for flagellar operon FliA